MVKNVCSEDMNKRNHSRSLGLSGRINLKLILMKENWKNATDLSGSQDKPMSNCSENVTIISSNYMKDCVRVEVTKLLP